MRYIPVPVHILAPRIGKELCYLLPLVHTLTDCDYTRKVGTKHAALIANPTEYLKDFDAGPRCTDDFTASHEAYLVQVFKRNTTCTTMDQLRDVPVAKLDFPALISASAKVSRVLRKLYNARIRLDRLRVDILD